MIRFPQKSILNPPHSKAFHSKIANASLLSAAMVVGMHTVGHTVLGSTVWWFDSLVTHGIFRIAVPFFFIRSGFFLYQHYYSQDNSEPLYCIYLKECYKRIRTLLIPFFLFSIIHFLLHYPYVIYSIHSVNFLIFYLFPHELLDLLHFLILKYHIRGINGQGSAVFCGKYLLNSANVLTFAAG